MKACVTGATGCVGRNLVDELTADGWDVVVLHRRSSNLSKLDGCGNLQFHEVDLNDFGSVLKSIPESTDAVFHVAANLSHWPVEAKVQWRDNVMGTRNMVNAALEKKVGRFILTSTGSACRANEKTRIRSGYILSKRQAEVEVEKGIEDGLDAVILRLPIVIGKYDYHNYSRIFQEQKSGKFKSSFPGILEFAHARDVARGHIQAYHQAEKGEYLHFGGERTTWHDVFIRICHLLGVAPPPKPFPVWFLYAISYGMLWISYVTRREPLITPELVYLVNGAEGDADMLAFEAGRNRAASIGYSCAPLDDALKDCYNWLIENNLL